MTISRWLWTLAVAAAFLSTQADARQPCPDMPVRYRTAEFGRVRHAIEEGCAGTFTQNEQLFVAGIAQTLATRCKLPRSSKGLALVERFVRVSTLVVAYPPRDKPMIDAYTSMAADTAAFVAGRSLAEALRCRGPEAALLSRGIVNYLSQPTARSRFVSGCMEFYGGKYTEKQCVCVAANLRAIVPDIDERFFDRKIIEESIHHAPFIAVPLMFSCGLGKY